MGRKPGYILVTREFHLEGNRWVATCPELGTATFGRSLPEAERHLDEAVALHLNTLEQVGESERFFRENNITFFKTRPAHFSVCFPANREAYYRPYLQPVGALTPA